ncbi:hypothetical protein Acor_02330 [Acrocarpospora corrugata]|uniref:Uncharacterized protein n=1 Tax=Acrocarpospora corrugata TaxID=35763 RepID=A0A5M3VRE4_9ACTN|nr:hypothetical protein [Acrocarpospora corrugata]GER98171.1 hypothetical protein Acor_02330 [Acrocarpospora corrugata]
MISEAPYGNTDPATGSKVVITCARRYIRNMPEGEGPMLGRCLGWVESWDPITARLLFRPIALFR